MKKLHLDTDALRVESFAAASTPPLRATVHAREATADAPCEPTSYGEPSCERGCPISGWESCGQYCGGPTVRPDTCP